MRSWSFVPLFADRIQAGRELGAAVAALPGLRKPIVLALPRGGLPVGFEVARELRAPLDVLVVRKLGTPGQEELAIGAAASGGAVYLDQALIADLRLPEAVVARIRDREMLEVERRTRSYRADRPWPDLVGRSVVVVDDGAATGATALAAVAALRPQKPAEIIVALPVAPEETCARLRATADRVVCLRSPELFFAVGSWFVDFGQVEDDEVSELLRQAAAKPAGD
jgi:putative phosphoribosyl transferase